MSINIKLGDKSIEAESGALYGDVLKQLNPAAYGKALAVKVNGHLQDLFSKIDITGEAVIEPVSFNSEEGLGIFRHSTAHLMAAAVKALYPETKVTIGPSIKDGFYYDFDREEKFVPQDLEKIESKMRELVKNKIRITREVISKEEAIAKFKAMDEFYKVELIEAIEDDTVSLYTLGDFVDLCRGPHVPQTGVLKAFKLLSIAGAYWRGDENNKMLQRIYGTSFEKAKDLEDHLNRLEEAKKRDHRRLGKELDLFSLQDDAGAGLVYWHPKGALIRKVIEDFWKNEHLKSGYDLLNTPHIGRSTLWETSGHLRNYKETMYSPMSIDEQDFYIKPMNCPFHIKIYKNAPKSYKQLPLRWAELGTVYRYEKSGVLHGLFRVRGFTQDDAHIFCTKEQLEKEIQEVLRFILFILKTFGFEEFEIYLSTKPEKDTVGSDDVWEESTSALRKALDGSGLAYAIDEGGGAFYGPKIDIKIKDCLDRTWQCSTIQVDLNLPELFDLHYIGEDGKEHRPIMIHRALMGSLERFFGILIEHYGGAFPVWLAPVQARICTIADRHHDYAAKVLKELKASGLRIDADLRSEKVNAKIRHAQLEKIPYMLVIGDKEVENNTLAVRKKTGENLGPKPVEEIIEMIKTKDDSRTQEL